MGYLWIWYWINYLCTFCITEICSLLVNRRQVHINQCFDMNHKNRMYLQHTQQKLPYILAYKPTIFLAQFRRSSCGGRLICGSCHTARVDSQNDHYLSATITVCVPHTAWTISRLLIRATCVRGGEHIGGVINDHPQTYTAAAVTWHHCKAIVQWSWDQRRWQHPSN